MAEYKALSFLLVCLASLLIWAGLRTSCGRWCRRHTAAILGVALLIGLTYYYDLPDYAYVLGIFIAPVLFRCNVRSRLARLARNIPELRLSELGIVLKRVPDQTGKFLGLWEAQPLGGDPSADPAAPPSSFDASAEGLRLALEFVGEADDDYGVVLWGETSGFVPAEMIVHHREGNGRFIHILTPGDAVENISGRETWMVVRARPRDFACRLLDSNALALLHELFEFRSEDREIYAHVEGRVIRIGASRAFSEAELRELLSVATKWIRKVRAMSAVPSSPLGRRNVRQADENRGS